MGKGNKLVPWHSVSDVCPHFTTNPGRVAGLFLVMPKLAHTMQDTMCRPSLHMFSHQLFGELRDCERFSKLRDLMVTVNKH